MKNTHRFFRPTPAIPIIVLLLSGCVGREVGPSASVSYAPPVLPIEITYDVTTGQLRVALSGRIQTPIGTFKVSYGATSIEKRYNGVRTLTIITGTRKYVYQLEHGHSYSIKLPSDENGQTEVRYSGTDENLEIEIPNPTDETIAELKQKLEEERLAREQAEAAASATRSPENQTEERPLPPVQTPTPTPTPQRVLSSQECQDLVAQYVPGQFLYIPPECQDMFRAYQSYLKQQEYEAQRRQQQQEYQRSQEEAERRRREEEAARRRERQIEKWTNIIDGILRRRRM